MSQEPHVHLALNSHEIPGRPRKLKLEVTHHHDEGDQPHCHDGKALDGYPKLKWGPSYRAAA